MSKKIILFANHNNGYAVTRYLLSRNDAEIVCIVVLKDIKNQWWKSVSKLAKNKKLNRIIYRTNKDLYRKIKNLKADYIISANWRYKLSAEILSIPRIGAVNFHNSYLPKYRGAYANSWAILHGESSTGVTLHWMTERFDDGKIIAQKSVPIFPWDTARELWERLNDKFIEMLKEYWPLNDTWKSRSVAQKGKSSYFSVLQYERNNEVNLDKKTTARKVINLLRSKTFLPYYRNAYFIDPVSGKRIYISLQLTPSNE